MRYAVAHPKGNFTSGRAEQTILFHKKIYNVNLFVKKKKQYYAAAGETGFHLVKHPV